MVYKLYHGSSPYLSLRALKQDIKNFADIKFQVINAETRDSQEIYDKIGNSSLFETQRGIIIKRLYKNKDKDRLIESILAIIEKDSSEDIIYFWEEEKVRVNTKYLKFFSKNAAVEEYDELNKRSFATWLKEELDNNGLKSVRLIPLLLPFNIT